MKYILFIISLLLFVSCKKTEKTIDIPSEKTTVIDTINHSELIDLPILSERITDEGLMKRYTINYSGFINQDSIAFTNANLNGKVAIANFFFTRCPSICPPMRQQLIELSKTIDREDIILISHTIDPENDTPKLLKQYSKNTGISSKRWQFVTAPETTTKALAKHYMTNFKPNETGTDFYHSSYAALLDKNRLIRGFYNILIAEDLERLKLDIKKIQ